MFVWTQAIIISMSPDRFALRRKVNSSEHFIKSTNMGIIITYDVPSKHVELKKSLFSKGYQDFILHPDKGVNKKIFLPNTTVYHPTKTAQQGFADIKVSCAGLEIKLERCIATQLGPDWAVIWGEPFS